MVVFKSKEKIGWLPENENYVKRIVGIPGDTVKMQPPDILINGKPLKEPEIFKQISESMNGYSGYIETYGQKYNEITLAQDEYFIIGDNAEFSYDSRHFGPIKKEWIIGKAYKIYEPIEHFGPIK